MYNKLRCILLIDDDEASNFLSKMQIEDASCTEHIQVASGGQEALDYLNKSRQHGGSHQDFPWPDLIFLDINMPAMNGWEFLEKYVQLVTEHKGEIIIVMLTTSLNPDDASKASEISCISGFENKPLSKEKLSRILQQYFESARKDII
jgi:CheY-like chemotaxis protein